MEAHYDALGRTEANYVALTPLSFLSRAADIFADRTAVIYGARRYSWAETATRSRRLASALARRGIGRGDTVAVLAANTPEVIEAHFGVPMTGAAINPINIRLEVDTVAYILEHGDAKALLVDTAFAELARQALAALGREVLVIDIHDPQAPGGEPIGALDYETLLEEGDPAFAGAPPRDEWDAISLNYTSGTSGRPKGVVYHHRGAYLACMGAVTGWGVPQHPVYLYSVPMFHCNGWCHIWTMALMAGTMICMRQVNAPAMIEAIEAYGVTHLGGAPIVVAMLTDAPELDERPLSRSVKMLTGGAPPPAVVLEKARRRNIEVMQVYGLTETYGPSTQSLMREEWLELPEAEQAVRQSWQGVILPSMEAAAVADVETGEILPRDGATQGEILLRGNAVMKGYYKDQEATAKVFAGGWLHSGDAAVWRENGWLQVTDRLKDVIISGGENISSVEVEGALYRHPAVLAAAVVARPDEKWGETPCAFIELRPGAEATEEEIIAFCRERLAGFKRPKTVIFGSIPKSATGKIQKFALRERARSL